MLLIMGYITALLESDMDNEIVVESHPALVACGFLMEAPRRQLAIIRVLKKSMHDFSSYYHNG